MTIQTGQTDNLADRLVELEQSVRRAAEMIAKLRAERDALQIRLDALEPERAELRALRQERGGEDGECGVLVTCRADGAVQRVAAAHQVSEGHGEQYLRLRGVSSACGTCDWPPTEDV